MWPTEQFDPCFSLRIWTRDLQCACAWTGRTGLWIFWIRSPAAFNSTGVSFVCYIRNRMRFCVSWKKVTVCLLDLHLCGVKRESDCLCHYMLVRDLERIQIKNLQNNVGSGVKRNFWVMIISFLCVFDIRCRIPFRACVHGVESEISQVRNFPWHRPTKYHAYFSSTSFPTVDNSAIALAVGCLLLTWLPWRQQAASSATKV